MKTVILCGGSGTRLWPISRKSSPKQFAQIFGNESLFEKTIQRNQSFSSSFMVVVNEVQLDACQKQVPNTLTKNTSFLIEPIGRNTAPAIALAAFASDPEEILLVLPSDHLIKDQSIYNECIMQAKQMAENGQLVTFGIKAKYPETGYGYIEADGTKVISFKEKPDHATAEKYVANGNYFWNSGMFCFKASTFLSELQSFSPDIYENALKTFNNKGSKENITTFNLKDMESIPADSIDYAVMEKSQKVSVVPSPFYWSDMGSFDSLYEELDKDQMGNTTNDLFCPLNSNNNLVIGNKRVIATFDINDLIIVDTEDALLIGKKGESQKVKELLEKIKELDKKLLD